MNNLTAQEQVLLPGTPPTVVTHGEYSPITTGAAAVLLDMLRAAQAKRAVRDQLAPAA
jgi:acetyl-CoA acetyltransferase